MWDLVRAVAVGIGVELGNGVCFGVAVAVAVEVEVGVWCKWEFIKFSGLDLVPPVWQFWKRHSERIAVNFCMHARYFERKAQGHERCSANQHDCG